MEHIWTKESRERQGQLPLLPEASMVVFDEGHLLEYSAQRALTYEVQNSTLLNLFERIMVDRIRENTLHLMERLIDTHETFFTLLDASCGISRIMNEKRLKKYQNYSRLEKKLSRYRLHLLEEFVFEGELYMIPEYELKMVEEYLDQYIFSMELFTSENDAVDWLEDAKAN